MIAGCLDGLVRIWDVETGAAVRAPFAGHDEAPVTAVAAGTVADRVVVISGCRDPMVRAWWLDDGTPVGPALRGGEELTAVEMAGRLVVVAVYEDDRVCVWDPVTARTLMAFGHHAGLLSALAVARLGDRHVVVTGDNEGQMTVSDLATGHLVARMEGGHDCQVGAVVTTALDDRAVVVSGGWDGTVRRWDLATGTPLGEPLHGHHGPLHAPGRIYALTTTTLNGRPVAVSSGWDGELWMWDLARGERLGEPLEDHHGDVQALMVSRLGGRPVVVGGGIDEPLVRVWDLQQRALVRVIPSESHVVALAPAPVGSSSFTRDAPIRPGGLPAPPMTDGRGR